MEKYYLVYTSFVTRVSQNGKRDDDSITQKALDKLVADIKYHGISEAIETIEEDHEHKDSL
jgi:hypothetical protein